MLSLQINNEPIEARANSPLAEVLAHWPALPSQYAVAVNGQFVPRHQYPSYTLQNGDQIDVVVPVSGG